MVAVVAERRRAGVRAAATRRRQERGRGRGQRQSPPPLIPQGRLGGGAGYGAAATCSRRWSRARRKAQQFWHKRARRSLGSNGHAHTSRAQRWTRRSMEAQNDGSSKRLQAGASCARERRWSACAMCWIRRASAWRCVWHGLEGLRRSAGAARSDQQQGLADSSCERERAGRVSVGERQVGACWRSGRERYE